MTITPNEIIARVLELATPDPGKTCRRRAAKGSLSGCSYAFVAELLSLPAGRKRTRKAVLFRWEDIDHSLAKLRLLELSIEMNQLIKDDERRIRFEQRGNMNRNSVPSLLLTMQQNRANEWAEKKRRSIDPLGSQLG